MISRSLFFLLFMLAGIQLFAGGFQVNLQGVKQLGMAHCGAGLVLDGTTLFFNPGAFAFVEKSSVNLSGFPIFGRATYHEDAPGTYSESTEAGVGTPFAVYGNFAVGKSKKLQLGIGIYTPFGSGVSYEDDWKGQFMLRELVLRTFFIQPTIAYQITDKLGIGVAPIIALGNVSLRKAIPAQFPDGTYGEANLSGSGNGYGFNVGIYYAPSEKLSFGLSHRSKVKFKADGGDADFTVPGDLLEFFPDQKFSAELNLPSTTTLGIAYKLKENLTLLLDVNYVGWGVYDTLGFDFEENTDKLEDQASAREYSNAFGFRIGAEYAQSEKLKLRGGIYYDMTPVEDGFITPETPDADKIGITAGASYLFGEMFELDLAILYIESIKRSASNTEMNFSGTFKTRGFVPSFGLNFLF